MYRAGDHHLMILMALKTAEAYLNLPCQELLNLNHSFSGWLKKRSQIIQKMRLPISPKLYPWFVRYAVLANGHLCFYRGENDKEPVGVLSLMLCNRITIAEEANASSEKWVIKLFSSQMKLVNEKNVPLKNCFLAAASKREMMEWFEKIKEEIALASSEIAKNLEGRDSNHIYELEDEELDYSDCENANASPNVAITARSNSSGKGTLGSVSKVEKSLRTFMHKLGKSVQSVKESMTTKGENRQVNVVTTTATHVYPLNFSGVNGDVMTKQPANQQFDTPSEDYDEMPEHDTVTTKRGVSYLPMNDGPIEARHNGNREVACAVDIRPNLGEDFRKPSTTEKDRKPIPPVRKQRPGPQLMDTKAKYSEGKAATSQYHLVQSVEVVETDQSRSFSSGDEISRNNVKNESKLVTKRTVDIKESTEGWNSSDHVKKIGYRVINPLPRCDEITVPKSKPAVYPKPDVIPTVDGRNEKGGKVEGKADSQRGQLQIAKSTFHDDCVRSKTKNSSEVLYEELPLQSFREHHFHTQIMWPDGKSTDEAVKLLTNIAEQGVYLVRSGTQSQEVLMVYIGPEVRHYHIWRNQDGKYYIAAQMKFQDIADLLLYYCENPLPNYNCSLTTPYGLFEKN